MPTLHDFARKTVSLRVAVEAGGIGAILKVRAAEATGRFVVEDFLEQSSIFGQSL